MSQPAPPLPAPESQRILVRRIHGGGPQRESLKLRVYCPDRETTLDLEECAACPRCQGFSLDSTWRNSFLLCRTEARGPQVAPRGPGDAPLGGADATPLSAIMSREAVCVTPDLTVEALTALLLHRGISGAPVVDEGGRPIGMVAKTDLVRQFHDHTVLAPGRALHVEMEHGKRYDLGPGVGADWMASTTVRKIMTPTAFTLPEDASVARAARVMAREGIHRLAVVSRGGEVVGVLSALDVVRWVAGEP